MKKKLFGLLPVISLLLIILILSGGCVAIPIDDEAINFQNEYNRLNQQLAVTQQQLMATQQQLTVTQQQLNSTQQQLADSQRRLMETQNQLASSTSSASSTGCDAYCSNSIPSCYNPPYVPWTYNPYPVTPPCPGPLPYPPYPPYPPCPPKPPFNPYQQTTERYGIYVIDLNDTY